MVACSSGPRGATFFNDYGAERSLVPTRPSRSPLGNRAALPTLAAHALRRKDRLHDTPRNEEDFPHHAAFCFGCLGWSVILYKQLGPIAEHIETDEQTELLIGLGCRHGQGFRLSRPISASAATRLALGLRAAAA